MNDTDLTRWIFENLDSLFPTMEWEQYSGGWRSHYHNDDFTLSSDKSRDRQSVCLAKSPFCVTDISRGTRSVVQMYADYTRQSYKEARNELFRRFRGENFEFRYYVPTIKRKPVISPKIVQITNNWQETENLLNTRPLFYQNGLSFVLKSVFDERQVYLTANQYCLREYCEMNSGISLVYFPYINFQGAMAMYKQIPYKFDGHRAHGTNLDKVFSAKKRGENSDFEKCFFGEHLVTDSVKNVIIVESEKTAIILDLFFKTTGINADSVVVACGGKCWLNSRLGRSVLDNKTVFLCPDLSKGSDMFDWDISKVREVVKGTRIRDLQLYDFFAKYATAEDKENGADIGDIILRMMREFK